MIDISIYDATFFIALITAACVIAYSIALSVLEAKKEKDLFDNNHIYKKDLFDNHTYKNDSTRVYDWKKDGL